MDFLTSFISSESCVAIIAMIVALANVVTVLMPSVKGNETYDTVMRVVNWASLNVGNNRNADDPEPKGK
jgi:uncharacterized ion transporter superfamily protein YfcC